MNVCADRGINEDKLAMLWVSLFVVTDFLLLLHVAVTFWRPHVAEGGSGRSVDGTSGGNLTTCDYNNTGWYV